MSNTPKFSVITVSFNQGEFIRDTIESVLAQNYPNFEHLVIDGGSTDSTLGILRSYPHLNWISEKDKGQSDALNKGFARASGDIIAWINSDDWYAPGAFHAVAEAIRRAPVVIGPAAETDRKGKVKEVVPNIARTHGDLLRYWIPYAWVAQPGVFFTREALEAARYPDGKYVDDDLYFCMDVDLWYRLARATPFTNRIEKTLAYFRIYEDNKTGKSPLSAQKENGRVYRRHLNILSKTERAHSWIVPITSLALPIAPTLDSIVKQDRFESDVIFLDCLSSQEERALLKKTIEEIEAATNILTPRYIRGTPAAPLESVNHALAAIRSPVVTLLWPGDVAEATFVSVLLNGFSIDPVGAILPLKHDVALAERLCERATNRFQHGEVFAGAPLPYSFSARTFALQELGGFRNFHRPAFATRELLLRIFWKGWHVLPSHELLIQPGMVSAQIAASQGDTATEGAELVKILSDESAQDPFTVVRRAGGWMPRS